MDQVLFLLAFLGILCLEVIEIFEKCESSHAAASPEIRLGHLEAF